ncbi:hypothetical protein [Deinococcus aquaticus]|uniref:hypothetical protein n=1 Tax=Deinococcus aquaticus TaxID=328692 RepID=UPI003F47A87E
MNQSTSRPARPALEPLTPLQTLSALQREGTALSTRWFDQTSAPADRLRHYAAALAHALLIRTAAHLELAWTNLHPTGTFRPYEHHHGPLTTMVLILHTADRQVAVQLAALATTLLEDACQNPGSFRDVFTATTASGTWNDTFLTPLETTRSAQRLGVQLTEPWLSRIEQLLSDPATDVLPVLAASELN